jgi:hypothetical protein
MLGTTRGLSAFHLEHWGASVFVSCFGEREFLIVQYPFKADDSDDGPPGSFIRLASAIQRELERPGGSGEPRDDWGARVPRNPTGPRPRSRSAEAALE